MEISSKNGENIDELLDNIEISIYEKDINGKNNSDNATKGGRFALNKEDFTNKGKRKKINIIKSSIIISFYKNYFKNKYLFLLNY